MSKRSMHPRRAARPRLRNALFAALLLCLAAPALAGNEPFVISDIRIDGLRRIAAGTVLTYLPLERGDTVDGAAAAEALRALYRTGFFEDVRLDREGGVLVVRVSERPAINTLTLEGNKDIKSEDLLQGLKSIGLEEGNTFDRLALDKVVQELTRQYNNRGKYNVTIDPEVKPLGRNRVDVVIRIEEGKAAKIRHVNLVGNERFDDDAIRRDWESRESNWLSWYRRDDQYSRERTAGDLEKLQAWYLDRGYVDIGIDSTQVATSPDRSEMFLTVGITEGEQYTVSSVELAGDTVLPKEQLQRLVRLQPGQTFSRAALERSSDAIAVTLGNIGHAFASVAVEPDIDRQARTVGVVLRVVPGPRVNVRQIRFKGNARTSEEVLRRELRQFEGSWYSQAAVDRSRVRLQGLGFFESVEVENQPVPERNDEVDVVFNVKETSSGEFQVGLGYSQDDGATLSFRIAERNFLGSGRAVSLTASRNSYSEQYGFSVTEPYFLDAGMALSYRVNWATTRQTGDDDASYDSDQGSIGATVAIPLSEYNALSLGSTFETRTLYLTEGYYPQSYFDFLDRLGDDRIDTWSLSTAWSSDSRNDFLSPTSGTLNRISAKLALPGSDVEYYRLDYDFDRYWRLGPLVTRTRAELGYADTYGDGDAVGYPFFERFYAGGGRSLRGFTNNSLGPCEYVSYYDDCRPIGGTVKTLGSLEFSLPGLLGGKGARFAAFVDAGNVFEGVDAVDGDEFRASTGLSLLWRSPMGPISISYGLPIRKQDGDEIERLQFSFGSQF